MKDEHREHGTIEAVRTGQDDHGISTWLYIRGQRGTQGFGGYVLDKHQEAWNGELCALFGVSKLDDLVGKHCFALRAFSGWNEPIEGIEAGDGRRFVATDFWRRHLGKPVVSVLEKRRASIEGEINHHTRRINDETRTLARLEADYVEWATEPGPKEQP